MSELTTQPASTAAKRPAWRQVYDGPEAHTEELWLFRRPVMGCFVLRAIWSPKDSLGTATISNSGRIVENLGTYSYPNLEQFKRVAYNAAIRRLTDTLLEMANQVLTLKNTEPITVQD